MAEREVGRYLAWLKLGTTTDNEGSAGITSLAKELAYIQWTGVRLKLQASNPKLQRKPKLQIQKPADGGASGHCHHTGDEGHGAQDSVSSVSGHENSPRARDRVVRSGGSVQMRPIDGGPMIPARTAWYIPLLRSLAVS